MECTSFQMNCPHLFLDIDLIESCISSNLSQTSVIEFLQRISIVISAAFIMRSPTSSIALFICFNSTRIFCKTDKISEELFSMLNHLRFYLLTSYQFTYSIARQNKKLHMAAGYQITIQQTKVLFCIYKRFSG